MRRAPRHLPSPERSSEAGAWLEPPATGHLRGEGVPSPASFPRWPEEMVQGSGMSYPGGCLLPSFQPWRAGVTLRGKRLLSRCHPHLARWGRPVQAQLWWDQLRGVPSWIKPRGAFLSFCRRETWAHREATFLLTFARGHRCLSSSKARFSRARTRVCLERDSHPPSVAASPGPPRAWPSRPRGLTCPASRLRRHRSLPVDVLKQDQVSREAAVSVARGGRKPRPATPGTLPPPSGPQGLRGPSESKV